MILTHRTELFSQANNTLLSFGLKPFFIKSKQKNLDFTQSLYVGMVATILSRIGKAEYLKFLQSFDLIIIDECHLQDFNKLFQYLPDCHIIGASATPQRVGNQQCLSNFYQDIVNEISIQELIDLNFLSQPISYGLETDLSKIKTVKNDFDALAVGNHFDKIRLFESVYENYIRILKDKKTIIFASSIESSKKLIEHLCAKGLNAKHIDTSISEKDRAETLKWFKNEPTAILSNVGILTAGFDESTIEAVILYRATKSLPLFLQMVGRGARVTETKKEFTIFDFGNNFLRHGLWQEPREWSLFKKQKNEGVAPVRTCKCNAILKLSVTICPYCGYEFIVKAKDMPINLQMKLLEKSNIELFNTYKKFQELEKIAKDKGYKQTWVLYKLKTPKDFFDYQKFKNYKNGWAYGQIQKRGIKDTSIDS